MSFRLPVIVTLLLAIPSVASAHGIGIEAKLKGDRVTVEAYFDDDTPAADSKVVVIAEGGQVIVEGTTDAKGTWSFSTPRPGKYKVTVDAGGGHLAKTTITIPSQAAAVPSNTPTNEATSPTAAELEVIVSQGPTRSETTGWRRWLMAGVGLTVIGLVFGGFKLLARRGDRPQTLEPNS